MYGRIFVDDLSKKYSDACCKFDINVGKILKKLFPKMDISCRKNNGKRGTSYSGIYRKHDASEGNIIDITGVADALPKTAMLLHSDAVSISFMIKSLFVMDGNIVLKEYNIYIWNLKIRGKSINLDKLGVKTSTERLTHFYIKQIIRDFDALQLCCGKKLSNEECRSLTNTLQVNGVGNDNYDICYRSPKCQQINSWYNIKHNQMCQK